MRTRELVIAAVLASCATNPDPRNRTLAIVQQDGHGAWIQLHLRSGRELEGELISIDGDRLRVLVGAPSLAVMQIRKAAVSWAELWAYRTEHTNYAGWGGIGAASTVTHGYFLVLTAPIWLLTTAITSAVESRASLTRYPDEPWERLSVWARFPQGMPAGLADVDLIHQSRDTAPPGATPSSSGSAANRGSASGGPPPAPAPAPPPPPPPMPYGAQPPSAPQSQ